MGAAFDEVSRLIDKGNHPDTIGVSLKPDWRDEWYDDCAALADDFDFLKKKNQLAKKPEGDEGQVAFPKDSLDPMMHTLEKVKVDLQRQAKQSIKATQKKIEELQEQLKSLQHDIADRNKELDEYQKIVGNP
jgi:chromosome segregation ATPase